MFRKHLMNLQKFKLKVVGRAEVEDVRYLKIYMSR
ncbi:hypothetical protein F383_01317 [Gossypium arboreum]|uniref:Uncharacterized protein n=1 Tax=Gossypium arboreum TaxID=29729 RepID=A0A0B0PQI4_GOSAR|nr:hypothetical protein F383_01317 [Gossypium arboreum]